LLCDGDAVPHALRPRNTAHPVPRRLRAPLVLLVLAEDPHRSWRRRDVELVLDLSTEAVRDELSALVELGAARTVESRAAPGGSGGISPRYQAVAPGGVDVLQAADEELLGTLAAWYAVTHHKDVSADQVVTSAACSAALAPLPIRTRLLLLLRHHPISLPMIANLVSLTVDTVEEKYLPRFYGAGWLEPNPSRDNELRLSSFGEWVAQQEADRVGLQVAQDVAATGPSLPS
jgi:hypothetical protein